MSYVLVTDNKGKQRMLHTKKDKRVRWKKKLFFKAPMVNLEELPAYYKQDRDGLTNITDEVLADMMKDLVLEHADDGEGGNARIDQTRDKQKLDHKDILEKLNDGIEGDQLIEELKEGNENFAKRTEFSKQKYINKKKTKYKVHFKVEKPTMNNCVNFFLASEPKNMIFLREDSFSLFTHLLEIEPSSRVFLVEKSKGCILAHITRVLDPEEKGHCFLSDFRITGFNKKTYEAVQFLGMNKKSLDVVTLLPTDQCLLLKNTGLKFTHLVLATNFMHGQILDLALDHLVYGGKIVVYSRFKRQLEEIADRLFQSSKFCDIQICDTFTRTIQVLSSRTHPDMAGKTFGGYILSAYRIFNPDVDTIEEEIEKEETTEIKENIAETKEDNVEEKNVEEKNVEKNDEK